MLHVVCLNVRKTCSELLDDILARIPHRLTFYAAPEDSQREATRLRPTYAGANATLRTFMRSRVVCWQGYEPLVLLCRDGGNSLVRHWLRHEEDRELVNALVMIDALHGAPWPDAQFDEEFAGVVEFARDCLADPGEKLFLAVSERIAAGSVRSGGFGSRLRRAVWSAASDGEIIDTQWADNIDIVDVAELGTDELPSPVIALMRSRLVPFVAELDPESASGSPLR